MTTAVEMPDDDRLAVLLTALRRFHVVNPELSRIVFLKLIDGLTDEEIAARSGLSVRAAKRDWHVARAWLKTHLRGELK